MPPSRLETSFAITATVQIISAKEFVVDREQSMLDRIVTYVDPITTAIIIFIVVIWAWSRLKA